MSRIVVTGGGGFVGKAIVRMAVARGDECTVIGRNRYPEVEALGARCLTGDIRDADFVAGALQGGETVIHVAALAGIWGPWERYRSINVVGTENVIAACHRSGVRHLVYTSTPSVVFARDDIQGGDEDLPYPQTFLCSYARSKAMAERAVLAANSERLATCAIRPHLVWGPGDPHLVPRLLEKGRAGQLARVGRGDNLVDISYVDNVAHAHLLAADNLASSRSAAGKPYFVSQGTPVNLWNWIGELYQRVGVPPVTRSVPFPLAYAAGGLLELLYGLTGRQQEPRMTRFLAEQLAKCHYFSLDAIVRDLGYEPLVSTEEGMDNLVKWITEHENACA